MIRQRLYPLVAVVLALLTATVAPHIAGADTEDDLEEVRRKRAAAAAQVDTLRATDAEVAAALDTLEANVSTQTAALAEAERKAAQAEAAVEKATARVAAKKAEIADLQAEVKEIAIAAYVNPQADGGLVDSLASDTIGEAELKESLLKAQSSSQADVLDQLERAREDLESARADAETASAEAATHRETVETKLTELTSARDQQAALASQVQARLDRQLAEAQYLADRDQKLSVKLKAEQEALAAKLAAQRAAAQQVAAAQSAGPVTINIVGSGSIVSVRGIEVHESIAGNLASMLKAADADGISLSGWGYRSSQRQVELRRAHCGSSSYAIYSMPSSYCSPPTAPPGASMHERGLAIDFTVGCCTIKSRSSAAYQWLSANAASYGLYNLPSEPWHWSVNGN